MSTAAKQKIIEALEELPGDSLAAVAEFVDFLRAKALTQPGASGTGRPVTLGGLWKGYSFSEEGIDAARTEAWSGLGKGLE
ncbi:hypothetical protein [Sorangium sp. So ce131]|uniref:hypothetical protein n=1 Tax=Sorangium sp. So ce131 TaxID=3133282 RepID=UPI003F630A56